MSEWFRRLQVGVVPLTLFIVIAGCNSDDGGAVGTERFYFGTNNIRECEPITVDVDLASAQAVVARQTDGSLDCELNGFLSAFGCSGDFSELDGGGTLRVVIDGCEVPPVADLFACEFSEGDLSGFVFATSAECDCVGEPICRFNAFCDQTPGICVSADADPGACEDCSNDIDDDENGFVDCEDQNCHTEECGWGLTTITCTTTSTTTTTTIP
jgi:hypothetical protein